MSFVGSFVQSGVSTWMLLNILLQSTLVILLASVVSRFLRNNAAKRHTLWICTLLFVATIPFQHLATKHAVKLTPRWWHTLAPAVANSPATSVSSRTSPVEPVQASGDFAQSFLSENGQSEHEHVLAKSSDDAVSKLSGTSAVALNQSATDIRSVEVLQTQPPQLASAFRSTFRYCLSPRAVSGLIVIWLVGIVIGLVRVLHGVVCLVGIVRSSRTCADTETLAHAESVRREIGLRRLPRILISDQITMPIITGIVVPRLILPRMAAAFSQQQRQHVLLHEFAHIKRRDAWVGLLQRALLITLWPQALLRYASAQLSRAREELCDNAVLQNVRSRDYAETLLALAERCRHSRGSQLGFALFTQKWNLESRVTGLLNSDRDPSVKSNRSTRAMLLGASALLAIVGGLVTTNVMPVSAQTVTEPSRQDVESDPTENIESIQPAITTETNSDAVVQSGIQKEQTAELTGRLSVAHQTDVTIKPSILRHIHPGVVLLERPAMPPESWVPKDVTAYITLHMKLPESIPALKPVIDELVDVDGFCDDLLNDLRDYEAGPRIDLERSLLRHLGNRISFAYGINGNPDSWILDIHASDQKSLEAVFQKLAKFEPQAEEPFFVDDRALVVRLARVEEESADGKDRSLPDGGVAVVDGHLMVSSNCEALVGVIEKRGDGDRLRNSRRFENLQKESSRVTELAQGRAYYLQEEASFLSRLQSRLGLPQSARTDNQGRRARASGLPFSFPALPLVKDLRASVFTLHTTKTGFRLDGIRMNRLRKKQAAENAKTTSRSEDGPPPSIDQSVQFLLSAPGDSTIALMEGGNALSLPGRLDVKAETQRFRLTQSTANGKVEFFGSLTLSSNSAVDDFLRTNAIAVNFDANDLRDASTGIVTQFIYLPHRKPTEKWAGYFGTLSMGGVTKNQRNEVLNNLKRRGHLLAVVQLVGRDVAKGEPLPTFSAKERTQRE